MKKILLVLSLLIGLAAPVHAASCDSLSVSGLPETAVIELKKKCVDMQNVAPTVNVNSLSEYAELGQKYGIALSEVAKSIGTTVNDLAKTPVGVFMLVMVAWKVMGNDLIGIVGGFIWFTVMLPLWIYMFHRVVLSTRRVVETKSPNDDSVRRVIDPVDYNGPAGPLAFMMALFLIGICISGFLMVFG